MTVRGDHAVGRRRRSVGRPAARRAYTL